MTKDLPNQIPWSYINIGTRHYDAEGTPLNPGDQGHAQGAHGLGNLDGAIFDSWQKTELNVESSWAEGAWNSGAVENMYALADVSEPGNGIVKLFARKTNRFTAPSGGWHIIDGDATASSNSAAATYKPFYATASGEVTMTISYDSLVFLQEQKANNYSAAEISYMFQLFDAPREIDDEDDEDEDDDADTINQSVMNDTSSNPMLYFGQVTVMDVYGEYSFDEGSFEESAEADKTDAYGNSGDHTYVITVPKHERNTNIADAHERTNGWVGDAGLAVFQITHDGTNFSYKVVPLEEDENTGEMRTVYTGTDNGILQDPSENANDITHLTDAEKTALQNQIAAVKTADTLGDTVVMFYVKYEKDVTFEATADSTYYIGMDAHTGALTSADAEAGNTYIVIDSRNTAEYQMIRGGSPFGRTYVLVGENDQLGDAGDDYNLSDAIVAFDGNRSVANNFVLAGDTDSSFDVADGETATVAGTITDADGSGALTKTGKGTLVLSSANTYSGDTTLTEGTIEAGDDSALGTGDVTVIGKGSLQTGDHTVNNNIVVDHANAELEGVFRTTGSLTLSNGLLNAGNSVGRITAGSLTVDGGTMIVEFDGAEAHDYYDIGGNVTIADAANVRPVILSGNPTGEINAAFVGAAGIATVNTGDGTAGAGDSAGAGVVADSVKVTTIDDAAALLAWMVGKTEDDGDTVPVSGVELTRNDGDGGAAAFAALKAAAIVDDVDASSFVFLEFEPDGQTVANAPSTLTALTAPVTATIASSTALSGTIGSIASNATKTLANNYTNSFLASADEDGCYKVAHDKVAFIQAFGTWGDRDGSGDFNGYSYDAYGTISGFARQLTDDWMAGIGLSGSFAKVDVRGGHTDIDTFGINLFASYTGWQDMKLDFGGGWGYSWNEGEFINSGANYESDRYNANIFSFSTRITQSMSWLENCETGLFAGFNATLVDTEDYNSTNTLTSAALTIDDEITESYVTQLGIQFAWDIRTQDGKQWQPHMSIAWAHEFDGQASVSYKAGGGTFDGQKPVKDKAIFRAGTDMEISDSSSLYFDYSLELASGFRSNMVEGGLKISF